MGEQGDRSGVDSSDSFTMVAKSWKFLMVYWLSQEEEGDEAVSRREEEEEEAAGLSDSSSMEQRQIAWRRRG
jgi:hypothetical protein